jgi:hypothetical protein
MCSLWHSVSGPMSALVAYHVYPLYWKLFGPPLADRNAVDIASAGSRT